MMPFEGEPWNVLLRDALSVLALPAKEQIRVNGPGCVVCDMMDAFSHASILTLENVETLSRQQHELLNRITKAIQAMTEEDLQCLNNDVLLRPAWQELRGLAADALQAFGWHGAVVPPFEEVHPGVWQRPNAAT